MQARAFPPELRPGLANEEGEDHEEEQEEEEEEIEEE